MQHVRVTSRLQTWSRQYLSQSFCKLTDALKLTFSFSFKRNYDFLCESSASNSILPSEKLVKAESGTNTCDPSTAEAEAGTSQGQDSLCHTIGLQRKHSKG